MDPQPFGDNLLLLERIGAGGMGEVFRARQSGAQGFEKIVAVKRILAELSNRSGIESLFSNEMRIAALMRHSNIAQIFCNGVAGDYLYYVMEYVRGHDLATLMLYHSDCDQPFGIDHVCYIIAEAAKGLHYAHTLKDEETGAPLQIIHRDITPKNIICSEHGEVKLLDFGIAKISGHLGDKTRPDGVRGSLRYFAPEQLLGEPATPKSDIFSLGIVLWELLAGHNLFDGDALYEIVEQVVQRRIPSIRAVRPDVPVELEKILSRALQREPELRYNSADEFHRHLLAYLNTAFPLYASNDLGELVGIVTPSSRSSTPKTNRVSSKSHPSWHFRHSTLHRYAHILVSSPPLRYACGVLISVVLGLSISLTYFYLMQSRSEPTLSEPPVVFTGDAAHTQADQRVDLWTGIGGATPLAFSQSDPEQMPVLVPNAIVGKPALKFDGVNDYLTSSAIAEHLAKANGVTIIVVAKLELDKHGYLFSLNQQDYDSNVFRVGTDDSRKPIAKVIEESWLRMLMVGMRRFPRDFCVISIVLSPDMLEISINGNTALTALLPKPIVLRKAAVVTLGANLIEKQLTDFVSAQVAELHIFTRALDRYSVSMIEENLGRRYNIALSRTP